MWPRSGRPRHGGVPLNILRPVGDEPAPAAVRDIERAYEQGLQAGRRLERRRRSHPGAVLMIGLAALAGAVILGISAWYGSFSRGGAVVDQQLAVVADRAEPGLRATARDTGKALSRAGESLEAAIQPSDKAAPADEAP